VHEREGERHQRLDREERPGEQAAHRDHRRYAAAQPDGPPRQQLVQPGDQHGEPDRAHREGDRARLLGRPLDARHPGRGEHGGAPAPEPDRAGILRRSEPARGRHQHRGAGEHERREQQERPPPARARGEPARDDRADQRRHHPRGGDRAEDRRSQPLRVRLADQDVENDAEQPGAQTLQRAAADEHRHRRRGARDEQAGEEQQHAHGERAAGADPVAELACGDHADQRGDEQGGERPAEPGQAVQLADRRRQRGGDRHRLERDEADQPDDADRGDPEPGGQDPALLSHHLGHAPNLGPAADTDSAIPGRAGEPRRR
jgi:hypothetical protein